MVESLQLLAGRVKRATLRRRDDAAWDCRFPTIEIPPSENAARGAAGGRGGVVAHGFIIAVGLFILDALQCEVLRMDRTPNSRVSVTVVISRSVYGDMEGLQKIECAGGKSELHRGVYSSETSYLVAFGRVVTL